MVDLINNVKVSVGDIAGPASYATGGFLLNLSSTFSLLGSVELAIATVGSLMPVEYELTLNRDLAGAFAPGQAVVKLTRVRYDKGTIGAVTSPPSGVTVQSAKFVAGTTTGAAHTHSIDHDHPSTTSGTPAATGANGVNSAAAQPGTTTHTHDVDIAAFTGSSASSSAAHKRSFEYDHNHANTQTSTNGTATEVASTTNLSGTTWRYLAVGF